MTKELQLLAVNTASDALESCQKPRDIARFIKNTFDEQLYPGWMCVVGQAFGRWVHAPVQRVSYLAIMKNILFLFVGTSGFIM